MIFCVCLHQYCHPIALLCIFLEVMEFSTILSVCANDIKAKLFPQRTLMSMFANNALLGGGFRVWIREQRKIKRRSKALLCL